MRVSKSEREKQKTEAVDYLRSILPVGSTVYTVLTNCSRSGMSRTIKCLVTRDAAGSVASDDIADISRRVACALNLRIAKHDGGIIVSGCGMDMGFHVVYELAATIFPDGALCIGDDTCPSNDHRNSGNFSLLDGKHTDGGYGLRHKWL